LRGLLRLSAKSIIFITGRKGVAQMARPLRIQYPGAFYHVMHRGNAGSDLFKSEKDREKLLQYFSQAVQRYEIKVQTYIRFSVATVSCQNGWKPSGCGRFSKKIWMKRKKDTRTLLKRNLAEDVAIYLSRGMTGESGVVLGRYIGGISGTGVVVRHIHMPIP
jgi:hypothetical protein